MEGGGGEGVKSADKALGSVVVAELSLAQAVA
jgi:hypothetical protein